MQSTRTLFKTMADIKLVKHLEKREELLDLFRVSFGYKMSPEIWNWKYIQNPLVQDDPEIIVAVDRGQIVAARPFLLAEIWHRDKKIKAAQPCDTMVHPKYRREKLFSRMNQFAIEYLKQNRYTFFYNFPNQMSRPGYLKNGWRLVSGTENLFKVTNPQRVISHIAKSTLMGIIGAFLYDKLSNTRTKIAFHSDQYTVIVVDYFIEELQEVDLLRDKSIIELVRDERYLRWRFDSHPEHKYKYILIKRDNELWGYAVVSVQKQISGLVHGMIIDYSVKDNDVDCFRLLIDICLNELKKSEFDLFSIWVFSQPKFKRELIKHFGFISSLSFPYNWFWVKGHLIARILNEEILGLDDIYIMNNWRVTYLYPDTT